MGKLTLFLFLLTILQLSFSSAYASGEVLSAITSAGPQSPTQLGTPAPCTSIGFGLTSYTPPTGSSLQSVQWWVNNGSTNTLVKTTTGAPNTSLQITSNTFIVTAVAVYSNGATGTSNTYQVNVDPILFNAPMNGPTSVAFGCTSPVAYSTSIASSQFVYTPPAGTYTVSWALPGSWAFSGASTGLSISAIPNATSAGNVVATLTLSTCPFQTTSTAAVTRPMLPPTFGASPGIICNDSTNIFTINPQCGPTSYIWTISGNASATFQANGTQSLTTTSTSAAISTGTIGTSGFTLSVEAVYPGGATSSATTENVVTGTPAPTVLKIIDGEELAGSGPFSFSMVTPTTEPITGYNWIVAPEATISGKTTGTVTFTTPSLSSGQSGDVYITAEYETTCSGWISSQRYYFVDEGSGKSGLALTLQPFAGMSQLAIIAGNQTNPAVNGDGTSYLLKSDNVNYTIKAVNVYNTAGQLMKKASFGGANTTEYLDIHALPNGIYFVQVTTSNGPTTKKFVVLH
jgi:hypothetical protein